MISSITKAKIPEKYSFVLKTKQLENILIENNINIHIDLAYWVPQKIGSIFDAFLWLPNENISYNRLYIRVGVVLKKEINQAREKMEEIVLPEFIIWCKNILALLNNSAYIRNDASFFVEYNDNNVEINRIIN